MIIRQLRRFVVNVIHPFVEHRVRDDVAATWSTGLVTLSMIWLGVSSVSSALRRMRVPRPVLVTLCGWGLLEGLTICFWRMKKNRRRRRGVPRPISTNRKQPTKPKKSLFNRPAQPKLSYSLSEIYAKKAKFSCEEDVEFEIMLYDTDSAPARGDYSTADIEIKVIHSQRGYSPSFDVENFKEKKNHFTCKGTLTKVGHYSIFVKIKGKSLPTRTFEITPGKIDWKQTLIKDFNLSPSQVLKPQTFELRTFDQNGNLHVLGGHANDIKLKLGEDIKHAVIEERGEGKYGVQFTFVQPGIYHIEVWGGNHLIKELVFCFVTAKLLKKLPTLLNKFSHYFPITHISGTRGYDKASNSYVYFTPSFILIKKYKNIFGWEVLPQTFFQSRLRLCKIRCRSVEMPHLEFTFEHGPRTMGVKMSFSDAITFFALYASIRNNFGSSFESKSNGFEQLVRKKRPRPQATDVLRVDRESIVFTTFSRTLKSDQKHWLRHCQVRFEGEEGIDAGGLRKEYFQILTEKLFTNKRSDSQADKQTPVLFVPLKSGEFYFNPEATSKKDLKYYEFAGKLMGKVMYESCFGNKFQLYIPCQLSPLFFKTLQMIPVVAEDMVLLDKTKYNYMEKANLDDEDEWEMLGEPTFQWETFKNGKCIAFALKKNGQKEKVTNQNKNEYFRLFTDYEIRKRCHQQIRSFKKGLSFILPLDWLMIFEPDELQMKVCGIPTIDVEDMKANTTIEGVSKQTMDWFWLAVAEMSDIQRSKLLQFWTASSNCPAGGFKNLDPALRIRSDSRRDLTMTSHTCFNLLDMPRYSSEHKMRSLLKVAIEYGSVGFGFQ